MAEDSWDRVEQKGAGFYKKGGGFITASKPKTRNGDESRDMAGVMGSTGGSWMSKLNEGSECPYPETSEALKTKNTRKNNDSFY